MINEASQLGNSVITLKAWGDEVVDSVNKNVNVEVNGKEVGNDEVLSQ